MHYFLLILLPLGNFADCLTHVPDGPRIQFTLSCPSGTVTKSSLVFHDLDIRKITGHLHYRIALSLNLSDMA